MYQKLIKNTSFYAFSSVLPQLLNLVLLPLYTRYLNPTEYGIIALVQVYSLILTILCGLSLHGSVSRFYVEYLDDEVRRKKFVSTIFFLLCLVAFFSLFLIDINGQRLINILYSKNKMDYSPYFRIATWTAFLTILIQFLAAILIIEERAKDFFWASIISAFSITILTVLGVVILGKGVLGYLSAFLIGYIFSFIFYFYLTRKNFCLAFDRKLLKGPLNYSIPLIPHALSGYIFMYSDRIILERYVSLAAIGVYALADQVARAFKMGVDNFNAAYSPHFLKTASQDKKLAVEQSNVLAELSVFFLCSLILITSIFLPELSRIFIDPKYYMIWSMVPLLASAFIFRSLYCFSSAGLFFEKKTWRVFFITGTSAAVNIFLNLIFVPIYGVMTAVVTTFIAYLVMFVMSYFMAKDIFLTLTRYRKILYCLFVFFGLLAISYFLNFNLDRINFFNALLLKFLLVLCYLFLMSKFLDYKTLIQNLYNFLKRRNT